MALNDTYCAICQRYHREDQPHDVNSKNYRMIFEMMFYRQPTWKDAMSHCSEETKRSWLGSIERTKYYTDQLKCNTENTHDRTNHTSS